MGVFTSLLARMGLVKMKIGIIILGLANSGKTTMVRNLSDEDTEDGIAPTVGFSIDKVNYANAKITVMDMSGQMKYKRLWEDYYRDSQGIVFVIDSADQEHILEAKEVMHSVLERPELKGRPLLIFCNKSDLPSAAPAHEIATLMDMPKVSGRAFHIAPCSALKKEGVKEGVQWLLQSMRAQY